MVPHSFSHSFTRILRCCINQNDPAYALRLHRYARRISLDTHTSVGDCLISVLVGVGKVSHAQLVFDRLHHPSDQSWNTLISSYVKWRRPLHALKLYERIQEDDDIHLTSYTFVPLLKACCDIKALEIGAKIHRKVVRMGSLESNLFIASALLDMYVKCGSLSKAVQIFDGMPARDVVVWTTMITGYVEHGCGEHAKNAFHQMQVEGIAPNAATFICILKACIILGDARMCLAMHNQIKEMGFSETDSHVGSALVDMYVKIGFLDYATKAFNKLPVRDVVTWTALISGYTEHGHETEALEWFEKMQHHGISPNSATFVCCLKACCSISAINKVYEIHFEAERKSLLDENLILGSTLVDVYAKCGLLTKAYEVFHKLPVRNAVSWTALIAGYVDHGYGHDALRCFDEMLLEGVIPNASTFVCSLKACASIGAIMEGQQICAEIEKQGLKAEKIVGSAIVDMLGKCGLLLLAQQVFNSLPVKDVVSWTALIAAYVEHGYPELALVCLEHMRLENVHPNAMTLICGLRACGQLRIIDKGRKIHADLEKQGFLEKDVAIGNALVDMYSKCGFLSTAEKLIYKFPIKDVISWTILIAGFLEHDHCHKALECFESMQFEGFLPNSVTFVFVLKACSAIGAINLGQAIHAEIERRGLLVKDIEIGNSVIDLYAKFGLLGKARQVFEKLQHPNTASWNALLTGYTAGGQVEEIMTCFELMQLDGTIPDDFTLVCAIKVCGMIGCVEKGQEMHTVSVEKGFVEREISICCSLVDMYGKCRSMISAANVFDGLSDRDTVTWTALISGYGEVGDGEEAIKRFIQMQIEGVLPNAVTILSILKTCGNLRALCKGREVHAVIEVNRMLVDRFVSSMLVDMYVKSGSVSMAQTAFDKLQVRDVVSWTTLITGYEEHGYAKETVGCFRRMMMDGVSPNAITFVCVLKASGNIAASDVGSEIHAEIERRGLLEMNIVGNTVVYMYARCGSPATAQKVFDNLPTRDLVSWNALLTGYAKIGDIEDVFFTFNRMMKESVKPDSITFLVILSACNRVGTLNAGWMYFEAMTNRHGISPTLEHHTSLMDIVGRTGNLDRAAVMMERMPMRPDSAVWHSVLAACRKSSHIHFGEQAFEHMHRAITGL